MCDCWCLFALLDIFCAFSLLIKCDNQNGTQEDKMFRRSNYYIDKQSNIYLRVTYSCSFEEFMEHVHERIKWTTRCWIIIYNYLHWIARRTVLKNKLFSVKTAVKMHMKSWYDKFYAEKLRGVVQCLVRFVAIL